MTQPNVVILTSGRGIGMYPFTLQCPIALCPIANVSLLRRLLSQLHQAGIDQAVAVLPARAGGMSALATASSPSGLSLRVVFPQTPIRGQVGNVIEALAGLRGSTVVIYGDSFLSVDFKRLICCHRENRSKGALVTVLYHRPSDLGMADKNGRTYHGVLAVSRDGRVTRFVEKPLVAELEPGFDLANAAVFVLEPELLDQACFQSAKNFSSDVFQPAVTAGVPIFGCDIGDGFRLDAGHISRWHDLNLKVIRKEINASAPGTEIRPSIWVGSGTDVAAARLIPPVVLGENVHLAAGVTLGPDVIIGNGCRIGHDAILKNAIVMEFCCIESNVRLDVCIVGPHSKISGRTKLPHHTVIGPHSVVGSESWPAWDQDKFYQFD